MKVVERITYVLIQQLDFAVVYIDGTLVRRFPEWDSRSVQVLAEELGIEFAEHDLDGEVPWEQLGDLPVQLVDLLREGGNAAAQPVSIEDEL